MYSNVLNPRAKVPRPYQLGLRVYAFLFSNSFSHNDFISPYVICYAM